jgi:predicted AAA+ superfamily ATPase
MYRKIINDLREWKVKEGRKPLLLMGARQVGKTWIMKEFGRTEFKSFAYVNCDEVPLAKKMFEQDYDIPRILLTIQAITGVPIVAGETLIILDELQEATRGLSCLKYFCENAPEYHVIAAGSLLGIAMGKKESFPVGKVDILHLYPLDFTEFIMASPKANLAELLKSKDWQTIETFKDIFKDLLRQYYFVGGMPEAVASFMEDQNLAKVRKIQSAILESYDNDIAKHASKSESIRIRQVFKSLPSQLSKENKKFIYRLVRDGARAAEYELAIFWLEDAGLVYQVNRVNEIRLPLKFYEDFRSFKLFMLDCGLFGCMSDAPAKDILAGDNAFVEYKGAFTEQFVLQELISRQIVPYYWSNDKTPAEIDFVIQYEDKAIPIEVKAGENVRSKSISQYIKDHPSEHLKGLRFSMQGYSDQDWLVNIPLYAIDAYFE